MNRKDLIAASYKKLNYTPREGQTEVIESVLSAFIDEKKSNVVLCLDTGAGKSIIAAVIGECLKYYDQPKLNSFILMHQNSLTKQYFESFNHMKEREYFQIRGAGTYECGYQKYKGEKFATAEDCQKKYLNSFEVDKFCNECEYNHSRKFINESENLITNYSYFFISKLWSEHLEYRNFHVFDEAHMLNEIFCDHAAVHVSVERLDSYIKELKAEASAKCDDGIMRLIQFKNDLISRKITEANYKKHVADLYSIYKTLKQTLNTISEGKTDLKEKMKFAKMARKYYNLGCKIGDFQEYGYEHVFDDSVPNEITIKPIFIKDMMPKFLSKYNLFMSATINAKFCIDTFDLNPKDSKFVTAPPTFPKENRPVFFLGHKSLNYSNMQEPSTIADIKQAVGRIVAFHSEDKGLIMTPSFKLSETIAGSLKCKVFEHKSKENLSDLIAKFKKHEGAAILISPSLFEGLDFAGDYSKYQIIVKTPFASLGDKRIKKILDKYPEVYEMMTLFKIIQGMGRSVRTKDDVGCSYFLDRSSERLYDSKNNIWKERYDVKT